MTNPIPTVSVVCAWYNRADYIRDTIDSILAQDYPDFEMIVINDGSPDPRVREILDSYSDPRLRVIHQENHGFTTTIQRAAREARGQFIAVQGSGDISLPSRLGRQVAALQADPGAVGSGTEHENVFHGGRNDGFRRHKPFPYDVIRTEELMKEVGSPLNHGDLMFRRDIFEAVGGYRPFFQFGQDYDLTLRMTRHGHFRVCREVLYQRRVFAADGVAGQVDRSLMQLKYAEIARWSFNELDQCGVDSVAVFGRNAGLFLRPSAFVANAVAKTALKYLRMNMFEDAAYIARLSRYEKLMPTTLGVSALVWLCRAPGMRKAVQKLLNRVPMKDLREFVPLVPGGPKPAA